MYRNTMCSAEMPITTTTATWTTRGRQGVYGRDATRGAWRTVVEVDAIQQLQERSGCHFWCRFTGAQQKDNTGSKASLFLFTYVDRSDRRWLHSHRLRRDLKGRHDAGYMPLQLSRKSVKWANW